MLALLGPSAQANDVEPWFAPTPNQSAQTAVKVAPATATYYAAGSAVNNWATTMASTNPGNCRTKTLWPHPSAHVPGTINAGVQQTCPYAVAKNSVEAKLWEHRWWGYNVIDGPRFSDLKTRRQSTIYTNASCRKNSIRVTGYGHYEWNGVHVMSAEVITTVDVDC